MKVKAEIDIRRVNANGEEVLRTVSEDVQIIDVNTQGLSTMSELASRQAVSCIYCGSNDQLSSQHIVPEARSKYTMARARCAALSPQVSRTTRSMMVRCHMFGNQ